MTEIWNFIVGLFGYVMQFCYSISFDNYALALLFYALFFKLLLLPFAIKQQKSSIKMAALRPKIAVIEKKYAGRNDRDSLTKKQQEIMELQQREGYSAMSGCLPLLIQMPIIIALYEIIRKPLTFISHLGDDVITSLGAIFGIDVAGDQYSQMKILTELLKGNNPAADELVGGALLPQLSLWGINFGETPSFTAPSLTLIIPFLVFGAQFLSMYLMQKWNGMNAAQSTKEAEMSSKIMMVTMPLMTLFFAFNFSAAIGVYWIYQSILGLAQSFILSRVMPVPRYTAEDLKAIEREAKEQRRAQIRSMPKAKSLHHIDDDDDEDVIIPEIRSKYGDEGEFAGESTTVANPMSNTQRKKTNKSKKKRKK